MKLQFAIIPGLAVQATALAVTSPLVDGHFGLALDTQQAADKKLRWRARRGSAVFRAAWMPYVFMR